MGLKLRAYVYHLFSNTESQRKNKAKLFVKNFAAFDFWDSNLLKQRVVSPYYFTYAHFSHPDELAKALSLNADGVATSSVNSPYIEQVNPLFPAYYGLVCFNHFFKTKDQQSRKAFFKQVEFLKEYGTLEKDQFSLPYPFDYPKFDLKAPWISGITQGLAASLFGRAHKLEPEAGYDQLQEKAIKAMFVSVENGGLLSHSQAGHPWIEEYPSKPYSHVLNGFIFSIIATIEFAQETKDENYLERSKNLIKSLLAELHHYQQGPYLRHNLRQWSLSNLEYQGLNTFQFVHLYQLTGIERFKDLALLSEAAFEWNDFFYFYQIKNRKINLSTYLQDS